MQPFFVIAKIFVRPKANQHFINFFFHSSPQVPVKANFETSIDLG